MASEYPCPECSNTQRKEEPGKFALIEVKPGDRIELGPDTLAFIVRVSICAHCGYVALHEVP